jgi:hypothetical protein
MLAATIRAAIASINFIVVLCIVESLLFKMDIWRSTR